MSAPSEKAEIVITFRVTRSEFEKIERDRAHTSRSEHCRHAVAGYVKPQQRVRVRVPVKDHQALAKVLALIGDLRWSSNINQLARASNSGSLPVTPDTERALQLASRYLKEIRDLVLAALGFKVGPS